MKHPTTRMLFSYWDALRGERPAPERSEIEPGAIRHILADTFILETDECGNAAFRLAGTRLCALFGSELKSRLFQSLWPAALPREAQRMIEIVTDETAGIVSGIQGINIKGKNVDMELLLLPLGYRGRTRTRILGALSLSAIPDWFGIEPLQQIKTTSMRVIWPMAPRTGMVSEADAIEKRRRFVVHKGGLA